MKLQSPLPKAQSPVCLNLIPPSLRLARPQAGIDRGHGPVPGPGDSRGVSPGPAGATPGRGETMGPGPKSRSYRATVISRDHQNIVIREMAQF